MPTLKEYEARGIDITTMTGEQLEAEGYITPMNELPDIVTEPGVYRARNGTRVEVHEVAPRGPLSQTAYTIKGTSFIPRRGKEPRQDFNIWHPSGRLLSYRQSAWDIIEKAPS